MTISLSSFFLVGPTAVGKSAVAHRIALNDGCGILTADSMQVYRGLDIGTAKPSREDQSEVRYWGIDLVPPSAPYSVAEYRGYALAVLKDINRLCGTAIVVGGTGLYIKSLTHGLDTSSAADRETRASLLAVMRTGGIRALQDMLVQRDPALYEALADKDNPRRLIRALERAISGDSRHVATWREAGSGPCIVGLRMPADQLRRRIEGRAETMYASGLLEEVSALLDEDLESAPTALQAIGYAEAADHIKGTISREEALARTISRTTRLAKKQHTWFRNQANVCWIDIDIGDAVDSIVPRVKSAWEQHGPTPISD